MSVFSIILDILVIFIFFLVVRSAYRKGFLRSVVLVVGYIASIIIAISISNVLASVVYENVLREGIIQNINTSIAGNIDGTEFATIIASSVEKLPVLLEKTLISYFGSSQAIADILYESTGGVISNLGPTMADKIVGPIVIPLLRTIICILVFIICILLVKLIARMFQGFYAIPIIGPINSFLGGLIGVVQGIVLIIILVVVAKALISLSADQLSYFNTEIIDSSYIFKFFYRLKVI